MADTARQLELLLSGVMDTGDAALAGGKVYTYEAGTTTAKTTWTDRAKTTPATNPVILDASGKGLVYADGIYKLVIKDADDVTIYTRDNIDLQASDVLLTEDQTFTGINTFTKIVKFAKGADVASIAALVLGDDGNYFDITGTTAVTSIGTKGIGTRVKLHFDAALTLTHHATNLILPGGANITTAAGDEAEFIEYATGDWRCVKYTKASGLPVTTGVKGADVVSEAALFTTAGFPTDGNYFDITGTTTITSIITGGLIGRIIKVHFDAALTLTHHATNLILPGGANITTAAGDEAEFIEYAAGDWRCVKYLKADGSAVGGIAAGSVGEPKIDWANSDGMNQSVIDINTFTTTTSSEVTYETVGQFYLHVPANVNTIEFTFDLRGTTAVGAKGKFNVNGNDSTVATQASASWAKKQVTRDVSADSGSVTVLIRLKLNTAGAGEAEIKSMSYRFL
jgi:hypothetical protein